MRCFCKLGTLLNSNASQVRLNIEKCGFSINHVAEKKALLMGKL